VGNQAVDASRLLVTHHPIANARAHLKDAQILMTEDGIRREYAIISGRIEEVESQRTDRGALHAVQKDQVLLIKDFMLEDSTLPRFSRGVRDVDVPAPVAGYIGHINRAGGVVDIHESRNGPLIARIRHMSPIAVAAGETVEYGQALGTQNKVGLPKGAGKHVHIEMDMRAYPQFANYMEDLVSGRLDNDPARRNHGIEARATTDDGVVRVGQESSTVRIVQERLNRLGYTGSDGARLVEDGVYRLPMQSAVLRYQRDAGLPLSGDLDTPTLQLLAPPMLSPAVNPDRDMRELIPGPLLRSDMHAGRGATDPLFLQAQAATRVLEDSLGRSYDRNSQRLAASMACLAKEHGFGRIDEIVLSEKTAHDAAGDYAIVTQGTPRDPTHHWACMTTDHALAQSMTESFERMARVPSAGHSDAHASSAASHSHPGVDPQAFQR